ncbi:MAG: replication initiation protein [Proteobacteria bacterium]|nr:replication initiation protein [Pseudomonadota bacterium]
MSTRKRLPVVVEQTADSFKKTNEAIGLRVSKGHLTFMSRKLFNVMVLHAQRLGAPGINAPIETATSHKYFWVPVPEISRDAHYNSNDTKLLKEVAEELQDIRIISETDREWTSERLIASVKLVNPAGLHKRGGKLWMGYEFPAEVLNLVMNPKTYTTLTLYYMTVLRTGAGLALYEVARSNSWKTSGLTERRPWEEWRDYLEGQAGDDMPDWRKQYKFFKDRVLKKALIEVNTLTDTEMELIEFKEGKRVIDLQFRIIKKPQANLDLSPPPLIDSQILDQLMALGIAKQEAESIYSTNAEGDVRDAIAYTVARRDDPKQPELKTPAAYFKEALKGRWGASKRALRAPKAAKPAHTPPSAPETDPGLERLRKEALTRFDALPSADQDALVSQFLLDTPALSRMKTGTVAFKKAFAGWLSRNS